MDIKWNLDYKFKNENLLKTALTHSSYTNEHLSKKIKNNERLEFLGDAVLDMVIGEYFFKAYNVAEGDLSQMRAKVVNESSLAEIAKDINLGEHILLGKGEIKSNGYEKDSILADAFEALIGAIYLDSNFEQVKDVILNVFSDILKLAHEKEFSMDYKSRLQEICQLLKLDIHYNLDKTEGPINNRTFTSSVIIDGKYFGTGKGNSIKKSEQMAAKDALSKGEIYV